MGAGQNGQLNGPQKDLQQLIIDFAAYAAAADHLNSIQISSAKRAYANGAIFLTPGAEHLRDKWLEENSALLSDLNYAADALISIRERIKDLKILAEKAINRDIL